MLFVSVSVSRDIFTLVIALTLTLTGRNDAPQASADEAMAVEAGGWHNGTPGLDPNEIINLFRFRRNRNLRALQDRLIAQEQDKFINYRFSKTLVKRITGLKDGRDLDTFMYAWKPDYEFTAFATDLEFHTYILEAYRRWERGIYPQPLPADK